MLTLLFDAPDATTTLASIGLWSKPVFSDLLAFATIIIGLIIGGFLIRAIIQWTANAFHHMGGGSGDKFS